MKIELNLYSNSFKGRPYIVNPRITIVGPFGVLKIIYYLIIIANPNTKDEWNIMQ